MEPERLARQEERPVITHHPIRNLFLVDVLMDKDSRPTLIWGLGILALGTLAYHWLEGWSYLDALYFCVISVATIGYGDLTPTTPEARLFTIFYVINGIVILLSVFDRIREVRSRQVSAQPSGRP
jgi:voltage-gated potassium channel